MNAIMEAGRSLLVVQCCHTYIKCRKAASVVTRTITASGPAGLPSHLQLSGVPSSTKLQLMGNLLEQAGPPHLHPLAASLAASGVLADILGHCASMRDSRDGDSVASALQVCSGTRLGSA